MKTIISAIEMVFNYIFGTLMLLLVMFLLSGAWIGFFIQYLIPQRSSTVQEREHEQVLEHHYYYDY
jgi:hypothetical protein